MSAQHTCKFHEVLSRSAFNVHTCNCLLFSPSATYRDLAGRIISYSYSSLSEPGYEASLKHSASNFEISCKYYQVQVYFAVNNS